MSSGESKTGASSSSKRRAAAVARRCIAAQATRSPEGSGVRHEHDSPQRSPKRLSQAHKRIVKAIGANLLILDQASNSIITSCRMLKN